jgi:SRSO17 transposase
MEAERHQLWNRLREVVDGNTNLGERGEEIRRTLKECELNEYSKAREAMTGWIPQIRAVRNSPAGGPGSDARTRSLKFIEGRIREFTEREAAEKVEWRRAEFRKIRETCEAVRRVWLED